MISTEQDRRIFSIGFNNAPDFFDFVCKYKEHVFSVYFSIPGSHLGSGRPFEKFSVIFRQMDFLEKLGGLARDHGIVLELLFNSSYDLVDPACKAVRMAEMLAEILPVAPVRRLTVCDRMAVIHLREKYGALLTDAFIEIENSIADTAKYTSIDEVNRDLIVFDRLKVPPDNYRNADFLARLIEEIGAERLTLTLNEGCLPTCPHRLIHNCLHVNEIQLSEGTYCRYMLNRQGFNHLLYLRRILPAAFPRFREMGFRSFKIANRNLSTKQSAQLLDAYLNPDAPMVYDARSELGEQALHRFLSQSATCDYRCTDNRCGLCRVGFRQVQSVRRSPISLSEEQL